MITKLLNEVNKNIETLNNLVQDKEYFEKLDERIEKVNNYVQVQKQEIERLQNIIKEVREYIENNSLYEQDYDYDYEENLYEYPPNDEQARKDILEILDKENKDGER